MKHLLCALLIAAAAGAAARADVAPVMFTGATGIQPREDGVPVAMLWEEVDLHLEPAKVAVVAVFVLKNAGPADTTIEVGFPVFPSEALNDFSVTIDGSEKPDVRTVTPPARKSGAGKGGPPTGPAPGGAAPGGFKGGAEGAAGPSGKKAARPSPAGPETDEQWAARQNLGAWMCWKMTFPAGRERKVAVTYWTDLRVEPHRYLKDASAEVGERLASRTGGYVLRTGRAWAGSIGRAVVRIHYGQGVKKEDLLWLYPPWSRRGKTAGPSPWQYDAKTAVDTLLATDLEPDWTNDVEFSFRLAGGQEELAVLTDALRARKLDAWGREYLAGLLEPGPDAPSRLALADAERRKKLIEVYEYCVPPVGPALTAEEVKTAVLTRKSEALPYRAFRTLFAHYRAAGQADKARAIAPHYQEFLESALAIGGQLGAAMQAIAAEMVKRGGSPKDAATLSQQVGMSSEERAAFESELAEVRKFSAAAR